MHAGFLTVNSAKMSKSTGNFITIDDLLKKMSADEFRMMLFMHHYRQPLDFSEHGLEKEVCTIEVALSDEEAFDRLGRRRLCTKCGEIVRALTDTDPAVCPKCGGTLMTRPDDREEIVRNRIAQQGNEAVKPIIAFYNDKGVFQKVDGRQTVEEVEKEIENILN
jgi:adenylate kinase family enzyme